MVTRSNRPEMSAPEASVAAKVTRPDTPASSAFRRAAEITSSSRSNPSTLTSGYASAIAMLDQPDPHARSATRAGGSRRSRWSTSAMAGSHRVPSKFKNTARLYSARPSGAQASGGGAPPVRNASTSCGSHRPARTISTPLNPR
jgi:hypothetical protein